MIKPYQVVVRARQGIELRGEIPVGNFEDRLKAEAMIEGASDTVACQSASRILKKKYPKTIITTELKFNHQKADHEKV